MITQQLPRAHSLFGRRVLPALIATKVLGAKKQIKCQHCFQRAGADRFVIVCGCCSLLCFYMCLALFGKKGLPALIATKVLGASTNNPSVSKLFFRELVPIGLSLFVGAALCCIFICVWYCLGKEAASTECLQGALCPLSKIKSKHSFFPRAGADKFVIASCCCCVLLCKGSAFGNQCKRFPPGGWATPPKIKKHIMCY